MAKYVNLISHRHGTGGPESKPRFPGILKPLSLHHFGPPHTAPSFSVGGHVARGLAAASLGKACPAPAAAA